ncbi:MAG: hypothetical protein ACYDGN_10525 [Acidimicrobiales bacterium]
MSRREGPRAAVIPIGVVTREATFRRLAELAQRTDPPPPEVTEAAIAVGVPPDASSAWRSIDDELAMLVYDSDHDCELLENVRSLGSAVRHLTFRAPQLLLEVEVTNSRPRALVCQIVPPCQAQLEVRHAGGGAITECDCFGTFHVPSLPPGPLRLRCVPDGESPCSVATSWFRI